MAMTYVIGLSLGCIICHGVQSAFLVQDLQSKCQPLRPPVNGLIQCSQNASHLVCTATCNSGYVFDSGLRSEERTCDDKTGSWINGNILPFCSHIELTNNLEGGNRSAERKPVATENTITACNDTLLSNVNDNQFTASSVWSGVKGYYFGAERARLDSLVSHNGTMVNSGGWRPAANTLDQYIQVKLDEVKRVTGIITKGRNVVSGDSANEYVSKFRVLHSLDGQAWEPYSSLSVSDQFLDGNSDRDTPVTNLFSCPFDALYVRVNPLVWNENIALRFDLLGCPPASGPSTCSELQTTAATTTTVKTTTDKLQTTTRPRHLCFTVPPPLHGVVNCEESGDQLVCVANCQQGYRFVTNEVLVKRVCLQQSGAWPAGQGFPACVAHHPTSSPVVHNYTNECLDVQKGCDKSNNGDYQACAACHFFATCSEGFIYVRACPEHLVFDSVKEQCDYRSSTCPHPQPVG